MQTGNGRVLIQLVLGWERQLQLLGGQDPNFEAPAAYLFRRCTVYKLKFHSESHVVVNYRIDSVVDGSVNLMVEFGQGATFADKLPEWKGPLPAEAAAPDVMATSLSCQSLTEGISFSCGPGARPMSPATTHGLVSLKRHFRSLVVENGAAKYEEKEDGENKVSLTFSIPAMTTILKANWGLGERSSGMEVNATAFIVVHASLTSPSVLLTDWERQGYPTLFSKVKQLQFAATAELLQALRSKEISIHRAWGWSKLPAELQREELTFYQSQRGVKKTIRLMVSRHRSKSPQVVPHLGNPTPGAAITGAGEVPSKALADLNNTRSEVVVSLTAEAKDLVLAKLRHAVAFQIGLWDTASEVAEMLDADLGLVLEWINATAIVADSGLELGPQDLEDFLDGGRGVCKVGGSLSSYPVH
jgi:hypothetical protein